MPPLIRPIRTEAKYQAALQLVAPYFDNEPELDSDAGAYFEAFGHADWRTRPSTIR